MSCVFYGSSPYVAAYARVIILTFHLSLQIVGLNFFLLVVTCFKKNKNQCSEHWWWRSYVCCEINIWVTLWGITVTMVTCAYHILWIFFSCVLSFSVIVSELRYVVRYNRGWLLLCDVMVSIGDFGSSRRGSSPLTTTRLE